MTKKHRRHRTSKKREVVEAYFRGESMRALSQKHEICPTLIPIWIDKSERGEFNDDTIKEKLLPEYGSRSLNGLSGARRSKNELLKKARSRTVAEKDVEASRRYT